MSTIPKSLIPTHPFSNFAYGSNMDPAQMQQRMTVGPLKLKEQGIWKGDTTLPEVVFVARATLLDYELVFHKKKGSSEVEGFATVHPKPRSYVDGVLWAVFESHLLVLDQYEGVNERHYSRDSLVVQTYENKSVDAYTYIAFPERLDASRKPSKEYVDKLIRGATHFNLREETIRSLQATVIL